MENKSEIQELVVYCEKYHFELIEYRVKDRLSIYSRAIVKNSVGKAYLIYYVNGSWIQ